MALDTDLNTLIDYVVDKVQAAWSDATVTKEDPKMQLAVPAVWVRFGEISFEPETVSTDVATVPITIYGRFAALSNANRTDRMSDLRTALLADKNANGVAYEPMVSEFHGWDDKTPLDLTTEIGILYIAKISAVR